MTCQETWVNRTSPNKGSVSWRLCIIKLCLPAKQSAEKIIFGVFWQFPNRTLPLNRINKIVEFFKAADIKLYFSGALISNLKEFGCNGEWSCNYNCIMIGILSYLICVVEYLNKENTTLRISRIRAWEAVNSKWNRPPVVRVVLQVIFYVTFSAILVKGYWVLFVDDVNLKLQESKCCDFQHFL